MARPQNRRDKGGTLILVSCCVVELARFEAITQCWNVVSVLCAGSPPESLVSNLIHQDKTLVAALDPHAGRFVLGLPQEELQKASGIFMVGVDVQSLQQAGLPPYRGDFVCMTSAPADKGQLAMLRQRLTSLRLLPLHDPDEVRRELRNFLSRAHADVTCPGRTPIISWR